MARGTDTRSFDALLESVKLLHGSLELGTLLRHLLRTIMGRLMTTRAILALEEDGVLHVAEARGLSAVSPGERFDEPVARAGGIQYLLPIGPPEHPIGMLGIGRPARGELGDSEREFLLALLGIAATAIDNARTHSRAQGLASSLDRRVQELETLLDMVNGLTAAIDPEEVARLLGLTVAGQWLLTRWAVTAWKEGHPVVLRQRGMKLADTSLFVDGLSGVADPCTVSELDHQELRIELTAQKAEILVPMRAGKTTIGCLVLGVRGNRQPYTADELRFAAGLASQAVVAFENAWNFAETLAMKKLEQELALAGEIQAALFPSSLPQIQGFELAARNLPAREVGGDYYDLIPVQAEGPDQPYLACVADVSGKGIAASLIMSNIQAAFRALVGPEMPLSDLVARCNDMIFATTPSNKFITAILVILDPSTGSCRWVNAGHNDGVLLRAGGEVLRLKSSAPPIGMLPLKLPYREECIELQPGDLLTLYSDGVSEANDIAGEELGDEHLVAVLKELAGGTARQVVDGVFDAVEEFSTGAPQYDDITMMVIKRVEV